MTQKFSNVAKGVLASPIGSSDLSLTLAAGQGANFPTLSGSDFFLATLLSSSKREDLKVTAVSGDVFTSNADKKTRARKIGPLATRSVCTSRRARWMT